MYCEVLDMERFIFNKATKENCGAGDIGGKINCEVVESESSLSL